MEAQDIKTRIAAIEQSADEAKAASASATQHDLRQAVEELHRMASQAKKSGATDKDTVMQIEQCADKARDACRNAGQVDEKLKSAITKAHSDASQLKRELMQAA